MQRAINLLTLSLLESTNFNLVFVQFECFFHTKNSLPIHIYHFIIIFYSCSLLFSWMDNFYFQREERERDRKKRMARKAMDDGAEMEHPEPEVTPPAAQTVTNTIQEHMREFRVS